MYKIPRYVYTSNGREHSRRSPIEEAIDFNQSLIVDGFEYTPAQLKHFLRIKSIESAAQKMIAERIARREYQRK
jgi:hypothetical protein